MKSPFGTFGYFQVGLPLIFVRADVLSELDPDCWRATTRERQKFPYGQAGALAKIHHELKHFHDTLLNPYLFSEFLFNTAQSVLSLLLQSAKHDPKKQYLTEKIEGLSQLRSHFLPHYLRYTSVAKSEVLGEFKLFDFLEVMAVCVEAVSIIRNLSVDFDAQAQEIVNEITTKKYQTAILVMVGNRDYKIQDLANLHDFIFSKLIYGEEPIQELAQLIDSASFSERIGEFYEIKHKKMTGFPDHFLDFPKTMMTGSSELSTVMVTCEEIEAIRRSLLDGHFQKLCELNEYIEQVETLPLPPMCFYSDDQTIKNRTLPYTTRSALTACYGDAFSLGDFRNNDFSTTICAGIVPTLKRAPCLSIPKVHCTMSFRFLSQDLFGEKLTFSQHIDKSILESMKAVTG